MAGGYTNKVYDGNSSFVGGVNELEITERPSIYGGVNTLLDEQTITPRYGFKERKINIEPKYKHIYENGRVQNITPIKGTDFVIEVINGVFFRTSIKSGSTSVILFENNREDKASSNSIRINSSGAGEYIVFTDYPNNTIVYRNSAGELRRADPFRKEYVEDPEKKGEFKYINIPEVPPSQVLAYNDDRLFYASNRKINAGDPTTPTNLDSPITFEESLAPNADYVNESFTIGSSGGIDFITALGFIKLADTTTGYGDLLISSNNDIYTAPSSKPREQWFKSGERFITKALPNISIAGQKAWTNVNNDIFLIDKFGMLRSFGTSAYNQKQWNDTNISSRIKKILKTDDLRGVQFTSMAYWDSKLFITVQPKLSYTEDSFKIKREDWVFKELLVLDFANGSDLNATNNIITFLGTWTGFDFIDLVVSENSLFIKGRRNGINCWFEVDKNLKYDIVNNEIVEIKSRVYSSKYVFKNASFQKELNKITLSLSDIKGDFNTKIYYKSFYSSNFFLYKEFGYSIPRCSKLGEARNDTFMFDNLLLGKPEEIGCYNGLDNKSILFDGLSLLLEFTGWFRLSSILIEAEIKTSVEESNISCLKKEFKEKIKTVKCFKNNYNYYRMISEGKKEKCQ